MEKVEELLRNILENIVGEPAAVVIEKATDEMGVLLTFDVAQTDRGLVIGRQGDTINAIRKIMICAGMRNHARVNLKMKDDNFRGSGVGPDKRPFDSRRDPLDF